MFLQALPRLLLELSGRRPEDGSLMSQAMQLLPVLSSVTTLGLARQLAADGRTAEASKYAVVSDLKVPSMLLLHACQTRYVRCAQNR